MTPSSTSPAHPVRSGRQTGRVVGPGDLHGWPRTAQLPRPHICSQSIGIPRGAVGLKGRSLQTPNGTL